MRISTVFSALTLISSIALGSTAQAEVYMHTDADGKVSFSDRKTPARNGADTEKVKLKETNSAPALTPLTTTTSKKKDEATDYSVSITSPADGASFTNEVRDLTVSANIRPSLGKNQSLVATLNGQRAANQSAQGSSVVIRDINRGQQQLQLQLLDASGQVLAQSQTISVNIIRRNLPRATPRAN